MIPDGAQGLGGIDIGQRLRRDVDGKVALRILPDNGAAAAVSLERAQRREKFPREHVRIARTL